jgi:3-hydroxyacyl-CoA dehydrogenase/enoyl-CoA hydratase/3-hydroxybutyryl-CoA epimerase
MQNTKYQHWQCEVDESNVLWVNFNRADQAINALNEEAMREFEKILDDPKTVNYAAFVVASTKSSGFIAGADIEQFVALKEENEAFALVRQGQIVFDKLEKLSIPTIALIQGFCLGGGLELVLACRYRIAIDVPATRLGLPEVLLGIHPGWGGCCRLPRLIGAMPAMNLILSGRTLDAKRAAKLGVVDASVPLRQAKNAVQYFCVQHPKRHRGSVFARLSNTRLMRKLLAPMIRRQVKQRINKAQYPAPFAAIDTWEKNGVWGDKAFIAEAKSLTQLFFSLTAKQLIRVFFLQNRMKSFGKSVPDNFSGKRVHVVGAGTMGGDIAVWCAYRGCQVTLQDRDINLIAPAIARAAKLYQSKRKKSQEVAALLDNLQPDPYGFGVKHADVIIEAIFEDKDVKQALYQSLEPQMKEGAILATNTSSIPLGELSCELKDPACLVGLHFFNPVAKMQLIEVVKGPLTSEETMNKALGFARKIDRLPLPVKSSPGFLVNRVLMPYLLESMTLFEEGHKPEAIDQAAKAFGMPVGPIELADRVGLDICLSVATILLQYFNGTVPKKLQDMVEAGKLGAKSGEGFYRYKKGKAMRQSIGVSDALDDIASDRMIFRLLNESMACLRESVVEDKDLLDAGMIFGTGFAPFRGGPMQYIKDYGQDEVVERLRFLADKFGERFVPDAAFQDLFQSVPEISSNVAVI